MVRELAIIVKNYPLVAGKWLFAIRKWLSGIDFIEIRYCHLGSGYGQVVDKGCPELSRAGRDLPQIFRPTFLEKLRKKFRKNSGKISEKISRKFVGKKLGYF